MTIVPGSPVAPQATCILVNSNCSCIGEGRCKGRCSHVNGMLNFEQGAHTQNPHMPKERNKRAAAILHAMPRSTHALCHR